MELSSLFPAFVIVSIILVVIFSEGLKKIDRNNKLKNYRVFFPFLISFCLAWVLRIGGFFPAEQVWFWWAAMFGFSIIMYQSIWKRIKQKKDE